MILLYNIVMINHTHTHQPPTTNLPTHRSTPPPTLVTTGVGTEYRWKYHRKGDDVTYERPLPKTGKGSHWSDDIEPRQPRHGSVCPTHHITRTPSGVCEECDD